MSTSTADSAAQRVAAHPGWYHTIDVAPGVATPGFCDLRPFAAAAVPERFDGARCLDVGTFDGFWAFELEARGAAEVLALDLADGTDADWPPNARDENLAASRASGVRVGEGFRLAAELRGSQVRRVESNVYDLTPGFVGGPVDVLLCGTLLQHLRDPVRGLEAMRGALKPGGTLVLIETYSRRLTRRHRRTAVAEFRPLAPGSKFTWWVPNLQALADLARTAGFAGDGAPLATHAPVRGAGADDHIASLRFRAP